MTEVTAECQKHLLLCLVVECFVSDHRANGSACGLFSITFSLSTAGHPLSSSKRTVCLIACCNRKQKPNSGHALHSNFWMAGSDTQVASWLDGASSVKLSSLALDTVVTGEPVEVLVSVSNPLGLELSISRMKLSVEAEPASQSDAEALDASAAPGEEASLSASEDAPESIAMASTPPSFSNSLVPQRLQGHPESYFSRWRLLS